MQHNYIFEVTKLNSFFHVPIAALHAYVLLPLARVSPVTEKIELIELNEYTSMPANTC